MGLSGGAIIGTWVQIPELQFYQEIKKGHKSPTKGLPRVSPKNYHGLDQCQPPFLWIWIMKMLGAGPWDFSFSRQWDGKIFVVFLFWMRKTGLKFPWLLTTLLVSLFLCLSLSQKIVFSHHFLGFLLSWKPHSCCGMVLVSLTLLIHLALLTEFICMVLLWDKNQGRLYGFIWNFPQHQLPRAPSKYLCWVATAQVAGTSSTFSGALPLT